MRVLFDQGTPVPLRNHLPTHQVTTAFELNWSSLSNGELLSEAEAANFEVLVTTDQNLRYQQNLTKGRIAVSNRDDELAANPEENSRRR